MAYRLIWAPSARLDLKEIASYIAESHPQASIRFVSSVVRSVEHLINFPESWSHCTRIWRSLYQRSGSQTLQNCVQNQI